MTTIENDPKPSFPFNMIEGMMPMYPMIAVVGWMIVLIAFVIGLLVLAPAQATFLSDAKAVRRRGSRGADMGEEAKEFNKAYVMAPPWYHRKLRGLRDNRNRRADHAIEFPAA